GETSTEVEEGDPMDRFSEVSAANVDTRISDGMSTHDLLSIIEALTAENRTLQAEIDRLDEFRRLAYRDDLTGLYNRRHFEDRLAEAWARAQRHGEAACVVLIDCDHFKAINDTAGHAAGDAVLSYLAGILREFSRECDIPCRLGGDEFALLLPHTDRDGALHLMARVHDLLVEGRMAPSLPPGLRIEISFGIAEVADGVSPAAWLAAADAEMYRHKRSRRGSQVTMRVSHLDESTLEASPVTEVSPPANPVSGVRQRSSVAA
ncbi:MAG: GGDEF domain-containing protein, partial [Myxococcota bacterium]